ncbi:MAG: transporter substrate-binding domain-containing protein [Minicystis sp.]
MLRWGARPLLALALVAGCAPATPTAPTVAGAPAATRPPAASLRVGTSGNYPPFSAWRDDRAEGFAGALLGAFAADQKTGITWTRFRWPDLVGDLRAGRFDLAADGITVRPERSIAGRFTVPVARGGAVLILRRPAWAPPAGSGSAIEALQALDRPELRVAVNRGGHLERVARSLLVNAKITAVAENGAVRETLARGEVDALMTNTFEAPRWARGLDGVELVGPLTRDVVALYVRADQPDLAARLDTWLLAQEQSGALGELRARHLGPGGGGPTALPLDAILCATAERLALMPFVAAAKQRTGKGVEDAAQEARVIAAARAIVAQAAADHGVPPPPGAIVDAFFQAQMDAAKAVQQRARLDASAPAFSLEDDLRPAIARITARLAFLLVRLPRGLTPAAVTAKARDDLAESGLQADEIARLAAPIAAFGP